MMLLNVCHCKTMILSHPLLFGSDICCEKFICPLDGSTGY